MSKNQIQRHELALQQKPVGAEVAAPDAAAPVADNAALASEAKAARGFESAFNTDFSDVQVHRDGRADAMGAQAYAQGDNIHLSSSAPATDTAQGAALLGHEVSHVVQQRQGRVDAPQGKDAPVVADVALEAEADTVGAAVARGEPAPASMQGAAPSTSSAATQGKAEGAPIQMSGAIEHKTMGDQGGDHREFRWDTAADKAAGKRDVNYGFTMTHGDIVMLSGDLFDPREKDADGKEIPDNLFKLARTPGDNGSQLFTQDEIMYAIWKENKRDPRFKNVCYEPGAKLDDGSPAPSVTFPLKPDPAKPFQPYFDEKVKTTVDMRYLNLAAVNRDHFANPDVDGKRDPKLKERSSGGDAYRSMHEKAITDAFSAGIAGKPIDEGLAYEAAAQHFLTDAFAGGHIRTPTGSIKSHWDAKYPAFWHNLKRFIAHSMAIGINEQDTKWATILGTVTDIDKGVKKTLEEKVAAYPSMGFERIVADTTHDLDNVQGVNVVNDLDQRWVAFGDGNMTKSQPPFPDSQTIAIQAVQKGVQDIHAAYCLPMSETDPCAAVKSSSGGDKYAAEQLMPRADPLYAGKQEGWKAADFNDLWDNPVRSDMDTTYGQEIQKSAAGGDIEDQLGDMADMIDETEIVYEEGIRLGTVRPRKAFLEKVKAPMQNPGTTQRTINQIIDFDPGAGTSWIRDDGAVRDEIAGMEKDDAAANEKAQKDGKKADQNTMTLLTLNQRKTWINRLLGGSVGEDDQTSVVKLFETCPVGDRTTLYEMIEGHPWEGHFINGYTIDDDELHNGLDGWDYDRVKELINEGA